MSVGRMPIEIVDGGCINGGNGEMLIKGCMPSVSRRVTSGDLMSNMM